MNGDVRSRLSALTPIIFYIELTHLGSEASKLTFRAINLFETVNVSLPYLELKLANLFLYKILEVSIFYLFFAYRK